MTRIGLIGRCDDGGLGNQTAEAYRHLAPDRTLVVLTDHRTRGRCALDRYDGPGVHAIRGLPEPNTIAEFVDGLDVVFTAETVYSPDFVTIAREQGCEVVVQANPEMWDGEANGARVVLPTPWEAHRVGHESILPVPIATDRFTPRLRTEARTFYHPSSPAMADRNGSGLVLAALRRVQSPVRVLMRAAVSRGQALRERRGLPSNVELVELQHRPGPYWEAYPDADVMLLPRRYGGLCLPAQEAAAQGMPVVMLDLEPQRAWPHVALVPTSTSEPVTMKGGTFSAYGCTPRVLADAIDHFASNPDHVERLSARALEWADEMAWPRWIDQYREVLAPS